MRLRRREPERVPTDADLALLELAEDAPPPAAERIRELVAAAPRSTRDLLLVKRLLRHAGHLDPATWQLDPRWIADAVSRTRREARP